MSEKLYSDKKTIRSSYKNFILYQRAEFFDQQLENLLLFLSHFLGLHRRIFTIKIDLHFPIGFPIQDNHHYLSKFLQLYKKDRFDHVLSRTVQKVLQRDPNQNEERLRRSLKKKFNFPHDKFSPGYFWCAERNKSEQIHYHLVLCFNERYFANYAKQSKAAERIWQEVLDLDINENHHLVQSSIKTNKGYVIRMNIQFLNNLVGAYKWFSYLCKTAGKENAPKPCFGSSGLPKKKEQR